MFFSPDQLMSIIDSELVKHIALDRIAHGILSLFRKKKKRKLTRSQRRKLTTKNRRRFVDNVIMHHQRIHQKNRDIVIQEPIELEKRKKLKRKKKKEQQRKKDKETRSNNEKWQNADDLKHKGTIIRGRIDARRLKARSKWLSVA